MYDFSIGSTLRHQYPSKIPGYNDDWFAELMLPEGAHNRSVDYTYIFLNRDAPHIDQHLWTNPLNHYRHHDNNNNNDNNTIASQGSNITIATTSSIRTINTVSTFPSMKSIESLYNSQYVIDINDNHNNE
jgi:hypothetical protein